MKRAMEELLGTGRSFVDLPMVEDAAVLAADLAQAGIAAAQVQAPRSIDVPRCATGLASAANNSPPGSAWRWRRCETGRSAAASRTPRRSYLLAIANDPERVERPYAPTQAATERPVAGAVPALPCVTN
jgi:hypothetical protein